MKTAIIQRFCHEKKESPTGYMNAIYNLQLLSKLPEMAPNNLRIKI
jgi:hypothetical protein